MILNQDRALAVVAPVSPTVVVPSASTPTSTATTTVEATETSTSETTEDTTTETEIVKTTQKPFFEIDQDVFSTQNQIVLGQPWQLELPQASHDGDFDFEYIVNLGQAEIYIKYDEETKTLRYEVGASEFTIEGVFQIEITLLDENGEESEPLVITLDFATEESLLERQEQGDEEVTDD